jgi:hypothetical protein
MVDEFAFVAYNVYAIVTGYYRSIGVVQYLNHLVEHHLFTITNHRHTYHTHRQ